MGYIPAATKEEGRNLPGRMKEMMTLGAFITRSGKHYDLPVVVGPN